METELETELETDRRAPLTGDEALRNQHLTSLRTINSLALQATGYLKCDQLKKARQQTEDKYNRIHDGLMERDRVA